MRLEMHIDTDEATPQGLIALTFLPHWCQCHEYMLMQRIVDEVFFRLKQRAEKHSC